MKKERWVRVCPRCGSREVVTDDKAGGWKFTGGTIPMFNCLKCGYRSPLFPEDKVKKK
jgi:hypothetical protein